MKRRFWASIVRHMPLLRWMAMAALFLVGAVGGIALGLSTDVPTSSSLADARIPELTLRGAFTPIPSSEPRREIERPLPTAFQPRERARAAEPVLNRPRIAIVVDDLGLSWPHYETAAALPGPVTLAFLPYGREAQAMLNEMPSDKEAIVHLPMEPYDRVEDAGPNMLEAAMTPALLQATLNSNLSRLYGYVGVNNHTGSKFSGNRRGMQIVLEELDRRGLYFLDSITTPGPVAAEIGRMRDFSVVERDVFLDPDYDTLTPDVVRQQLRQLEAIAIAEGEAIGIGHPYKTTMRVLASWMSGAEERGFDLVLVSELAPVSTKEALAKLR